MEISVFGSVLFQRLTLIFDKDVTQPEVAESKIGEVTGEDWKDMLTQGLRGLAG